MTAPHLSATTETTTSAQSVPPLPKPGRPSLFSPEYTAAICAIIRAEGISDTAAGALAGVTSSTLARWKLENEGFALELEQARAWYEVDLVRKIRETRKRDGSIDWRAHAWLLRHSSPEGYGPRSRMRKAKEEPEAPGRSAASREKCAICPETPARAERVAASKAESGEEDEAAAAFENHAIRPETPAPRLSRQERRSEERRRMKAMRQALKEAA